MHIEDLIKKLLAEQSIGSVEEMQEFLDWLSDSDQLAIISAYFIGIRFYGYNSPQPDTEPFHRNVQAHLSPAEYAKILFSKRGEFNNAMSSFMRCTTKEQRDHF